MELGDAWDPCDALRAAPTDATRRTRHPIATLRSPREPHDRHLFVKIGLNEDEASRGVGLDKAGLKAAIEQTLRGAGLPVITLPRPDFARRGGLAYLALYLDLREMPGPPEGQGRLLYCFTLNYQQPAYLPANDTLIDLVTTWENGALGWAERSEAKEAILRHVTREVEVFVGDWHEANS